MGREDIVNRSDGEHSIVSLKEKAAQLAEVAAVLEESPVGQSRINGEIECAVKEVRGLIWSFKSYLEHKLKIETNRRHAIFTWLPTYVADVPQQAPRGS